MPVALRALVGKAGSSGSRHGDADLRQADRRLEHTRKQVPVLLAAERYAVPDRLDSPDRDFALHPGTGDPEMGWAWGETGMPSRVLGVFRTAPRHDLHPFESRPPMGRS